MQRSSLSPGERQRAGSPDHKKLKRDNTENSDGEKSDQDLVVDDANESGAATNGNHHSPRENGIDGKKSPGSESSSSGKKKEESGKKPSQRSTPTSKPHGNVTPLPGKKGTEMELAKGMFTKFLSISPLPRLRRLV